MSIFYYKKGFANSATQPIAVLAEEGTDVGSFESFSLEDAGGDKSGAPAEEKKEAPESKGAGEAAPAPSAEPEPVAQEPETTGEKLQPSLDREPVISPAAKALALEKGVSIKSLKGTGRGGQITKEDVV